MNNPWDKSKCITCHRTGASADTGRCDDCWDVEYRLEWYLTTPGGLQTILEAIKDAGLSEKAYGTLLAHCIAKELKSKDDDNE